jgi:hypothetical protein
VDYEANHLPVADLRKLQHALASRHLGLLGCNTLPQHPASDASRPDAINPANTDDQPPLHDRLLD